MPTIQPYHVYKLYDADGEFAGTIPKVLSDFGYHQVLNTAAAELQIVVGIPFKDIGATEVVDNLVDEAGNFIIDEDGDQIVTSLDYSFTAAQINLGNRVTVFEYSDDNPNGVQVFDGVITQWSGDYDTDTTSLTVLSYGFQMSNYIIGTTSDLTVQQDDTDTSVQLNPGTIARAQSFQLLADADISSVEVLCKAVSSGFPSLDGAIGRLTLREGLPTAPGAILSQVAFRSVFNTTDQLVSFQFPTAVSLTALTNYHWVIEDVGRAFGGWRLSVSYMNSDIYSGGSAYTGTELSGTWTIAAYDMTFQISASSLSVGAEFDGEDPADIVRFAIDHFAAQGGQVTYDADTIEDTGLSVAYNFKLATISEVIEKARELSPGNWYWFVDPGSNVLYFKAVSSELDHQLILGRHITAFNIERRLDDLVNAAYLSGGDDGTGENYFALVTNQGSINQYGQWLARISDNRVDNQDAAEALANGAISANSSPAFTVAVTIPLAKYDTASIILGQTIGFAGFGNLIDTLELQVVSKRTAPDVIVLELGSLRPRVSRQIEEHEQRLIALETVDNPDTPS